MPGACASIVTILGTVSYLLFKASTLAERSDYVIQTERNDGFFNPKNVEDRFGRSNDFVVAAGLADEYLKIVTPPPEVGSLKFYLKTWEIGAKPLEFKPVKI